LFLGSAQDGVMCPCELHPLGCN